MAVPAQQGPLGAVLTALHGLPPPDMALPALEPAQNRETYRERPETELEEAIWYSAEETDTLVEPTKIRLRSIYSKQPTVITFTNKSPYRVRALWIDFKGNEVVYSVLEPSSTRRYHTYTTHPWIVRELHTGTRMMLSGCPAVVGLSTEQTVEIAAPPLLQWSTGTFCAFPEAYKASVQSLLVSHKQLEQCTQQRSFLQPLQLTPPCSSASAMPCSPRATLAHQGALPTSPKAPRLSVSTMPASPSPAVRCSTPRTPRAMPLAGSPAGSGDAGATSTTSISISSEASHFKATLTVSSPMRAVMQQTVNIEVFNNPSMGPLASNTATTVNFGTQLGAGCSTATAAEPTSFLAPASASASHSGSAHSGRRVGGKSRTGLFNNLVHSFKHAFRPSVRHMPEPTGNQAAPTTHITLHLSQLLASSTPEPVDMEVDEPAPGPWPPVGTHLGHLPSHLLTHIAELAAPVAWQTADRPPKGRPDIQPIMLACPPKTAEEVDAEHAAEQQQQQQQGNVGGQNDGMPALI